jgi:hypothetical protein
MWALLDLSVPGVCQSDDLEASLATTQRAVSVKQAEFPVFQTQSADPNDSSGKPGPEDCFCCSSHEAPSQFFSITRLFPVLEAEPEYVIGVPQGFTPLLYHPPKA